MYYYNINNEWLWFYKRWNAAVIVKLSKSYECTNIHCIHILQGKAVSYLYEHCRHYEVLAIILDKSKTCSSQLYDC